MNEIDEMKETVFKVWLFFTGMSEDQSNKGNTEMACYFSHKAEGVMAVINCLGWEDDFEYYIG